MDARERLRRYLEQRRELGETELMLDGMTVEDVLRVLGAQNLAAGVGARRATAPESAHAWGASTFKTVASEAPAAVPEAGGTPAISVPAAPGAERQRSAEMDHGGDWRAALRAAGGASESELAARAKLAANPSPPSVAPPPAGDVLDVGAPMGLSVGDASRTQFAGALAGVGSLEEIAALVARCQACPLYATAIMPVPGEGSPTADLMCVGEAPGQKEDETGRPFVGAAGQLLTKILLAIDMPREAVFIANVLKHRPPGNRNPLPEEVRACSPYLVKQIEMVRPKVIVAFGTFAAQTLLNTTLALGKLRGSVHRYYGVPLVVTYHPAALLRNPAWKRPTWEDVQLARRILDRALAAGA